MILINENERISIKAIIKVLSSIKEKTNKEELQEIITNKKAKFEFDKNTISKFEDDTTCAFFDLTPATVLENSGYLKDNINNRDLTYRTELLKEYNSILIQTKILFWGWISAVLMCYVIVGFCLYLIFNKRFIDSACSLVLEGLVYAVQKIFSIREDHYRELINNKIGHLQKGDFIEYAISKMEVISNISEKDKKMMEIIDDIRNLCD